MILFDLRTGFKPLRYLFPTRSRVFRQPVRSYMNQAELMRL